VSRSRSRRLGRRPLGPFRHGVASFDPTSDSVLLWTRLSDEDGAARAGTVSWEVRDAPSGGRRLASGAAEATVEADGTVCVDVQGLPPDQVCWYRFTCDGAASPIGRTRTMPSGPAARARLAVVCCADLLLGRLTGYRAVAERDVDLVVHLGDYMYADTLAGERAVAPGHPTVTLADYRARYAAYREDGDVQALHQAHPMVAIWDDHDLADDAWRGGARAHDPHEDGPWFERAAAAARSRQEWVPARLHDDGRIDRLWRALGVGELVDLVMLDARWWGRWDDPEGPLDDPRRDLLGEDQWRWLEDRLAESRARWRVVASQVVVHDLTVPVPSALPVPDAVTSAGLAPHAGRLVRLDQWDGYPASRRRLAEVLGRAAPDTVLVAGDLHAAMAFSGPLDRGAEDQPTVAEFVCPPVLSTTFAATVLTGLGPMAELFAPALTDLEFADLDHTGFLLLDVTPARLEATWWSVGAVARTTGIRPRPLAGYALAAGTGPELHPVDRIERDHLDAVAPRRPGDEPPLPPPSFVAKARTWRRLALLGLGVAAVGTAVVRRLRAAR